MKQKKLIGLKEALQQTTTTILPLPPVTLPLLEAVDCTLAEDIIALVDSPSVNGSTKDGYAIISEDIESASKESPAHLKVSGTLYAGGEKELQIVPGTAARILTGAEVPGGATAVVAEEFTRINGDKLEVFNTAERGRNIIPRGSDIKKGERLATKGQRITPGLLGLAAAAGLDKLPVTKRLKVGLLATGDEIVAPGNPLPRGKLYASNVTTLAGWCQRFGFEVDLRIAKDKPEVIHSCFEKMMENCDALITSGGAWTGDHDLVAKVLIEMGGNIIFHRLRIGPGKATGLGMLKEKPLFILPGGPPSNLMGFLQIALPGLMRLANHPRQHLPVQRVRCGEEMRTGHADWVQFIFGRLDYQNSGELPLFIPLLERSRLRSMAEAEAIIAVPEGQTAIGKETIIQAQLLR